MLNELKFQVMQQLKHYPQCRNSDIALTIAIWQQYYPQRIRNDSIRLVDLYDLPREDNVKRIRAKLQEEALKRIAIGRIDGNEIYFLPTSLKVAKQRKINAAIWEKALGYFRNSSLSQSERLPRPVGLVGFTKIDENHYIADGANGNKYNVSRVDVGYHWKCECDAHRYHHDMDCKHIKEVEKYLENIDKKRAAEAQHNLF